MKYIAFALLVGFSLSLQAQVLTGNWQSDLQNEIKNFRSCKNDENQNNKCYQHIGETLHSLYKLSDFYSNSSARYMMVSEIHDFLESSSKWKLLGKGYNQSVLDQAQQLANKKMAVVAVYLNEDRVGQIAYILPGEMVNSGSWKLRVPNSSAFISNEPEKSYMGKGLSYSFPRRLIANVQIYSREI